MRPHPRVSRQNYAVVAVAVDIEHMIVIEQPQRIKPLHLGLRALLPIYPPKIHSHFFVWMMQNVEIRIAKFLVGEIELYSAFGLRIDAASARHIGILLFKISHAVARMQIHCYGKISAFEILQKSFGIGEQFLFKRVTCPPCALKRLVVCVFGNVCYDVPVHVYRGNSKRNVFVLEFVHKGKIFLVGVGMIA